MTRLVAGLACVGVALCTGAVLASAGGRSDPYARSEVLVAAPPAPVAGVPDVRTSADPPGPAPQVHVAPDWIQNTAAATGLAPRVLRAYAGAEVVLATEQPACGLGWALLAGIGALESGHGTIHGSGVGPDGVVSPPVVGPALDGSPGLAALRDSEDGALDGDPTWDRAVGPMQFLPSTWARWAADGDGDGVADPQQVDDAALAAGRYLCASGDVETADHLRRALLSYNRSGEYAARVVATANRDAVASTASTASTAGS